MRIICTLGVLFLLAGSALAQTKPAAARDDYSGMYSFLKDGEFVQINLADQGKVTGFISRFGDQESDRGQFLDQFFKQGSLVGNRMQFATQEVHAVRFEFKGTIGRGAGKTPDDEDYYEMKGTLTEYTSDANHQTSARSREVTFKSFPQDVAGGKTH